MSKLKLQFIVEFKEKEWVQRIVSKAFKEHAEWLLFNDVAGQGFWENDRVKISWKRIYDERRKKIKMAKKNKVVKKMGKGTCPMKGMK